MTESKKNSTSKNSSDTLEQVDDLLFHLEISIRYHTARLRWYENWRKMNLLFIILFSLAAILPIIPVILSIIFNQSHSYVSSSFASLALIIAVSDLVFDNGGQERLHDRLLRRFSDIEAEVRSEDKPKNGQLKDWNYKLYKILPDGPPIYRALNALCENQTRQAQGDQKRAEVNYFQICFKHMFHFEGTPFDKKDE